MKNIRTMLIGTAAAAVGLAIGLGGTAIAGSNGNSSAPENPSPVVHEALVQPNIAGPCNTWAVVDSDATLARTGCSGAYVLKVGTGDYQVTFTKNVRFCAFEATLGTSGHGYVGDPGMVSVVSRSGNKDAVYVATRNDAGVSHDLGFHLVVTC